MRLGLGLPQFGPAVGDAASLTRFAARAEQMGYDSLWTGDRLFVPAELKSPYPGTDAELREYLPVGSRNTDPFVLVAIAIAATTRMRFSFSTLNAPLREPIGLAQTLTTLDVMSNGRLDAGFGLGWMRDEYDVLGLPWSRRGRRLDDILSFLHTWWTCNPVAYDGPFVSLPPSRVDLRPVQAGGPPVYLAGAAPAALERVGRRAAGWLTFDAIPGETMAGMRAIIARAAEEAGRDPGAIRTVARINAAAGETTAHLSGRVNRARDLGADEVIIDFFFAQRTIEGILGAAEPLVSLRAGA